MLDLHHQFFRYRKYIFFLLSFYVIGWGFTSYQPVFLGLILGTSISLFNLWLMVRKHKQFGKAMDEGRSVRSLGTASRMASAGFAVLISLEFPDELHLVSVVIGLMTMYFVIMIDYFVQLLRT
ncbi:ATP synthase subunit [Bacillus lacus]|uniref:ATP synthase subunit n=1 Tax=Metabacillus lacus TaxID=1983721 RepID=A0A7X2J2A5_9BACI|nr:ATP synthase subunit I [Metabacillus lacus]MRX74146.1 ATP synthase subunit [Metabacillus lacus]